MILKWIDHPAFRREDQLLGVIHDAGIIRMEQICTITGWERRTVEDLIYNLRNRASEKMERSLWVKSVKLPIQKPKGKKAIAYALGQLGMQYVKEMRQDEDRLREAPEAQAMHYIGINDILVRLLNTAPSMRSRIQWITGTEANDVLQRLLEQRKHQVERKKMIRPDALLVLDLLPFWIEFDNDTETTRKIEKKLQDYVMTLASIDENEMDSVIWVAPTRKRAQSLEETWKILTHLYFKAKPVPKMHFFSAGEESPFLLANKQNL